MKALVTGGAGFIGSHLCEALLAQGFRVTAVDDLSTGKRQNVPRRVDFHKLDVRSPKLSALVRRLDPDYICHLAAQPSVPRSLADPHHDVDVNIGGSVNLLEAARAAKIKKFLFVSSGGAIYGDADAIPTSESVDPQPQSPYAIAKYAVERYLDWYTERYGLPSVVVRPANVYGPRQDGTGEAGVVSIFARRLLASQVLSIHGTGQQTRDLVYVGDVVRALVAALERGRGTYNVGTGSETSVRDLAVLLGRVAGLVPRVAYTTPRGYGDLARSALDCRLVQRALGWRPEVALADGLRQTLDWFRETTR